MEAPNTNLPPVIYLSFSNNQDAYLELLKEEARSLTKILSPLQESDRYTVYKEEGVDLTELFAGFRRFRNRIEIFHYGGHADSDHLLLEGQKVNSNGLAELFTAEANLKLIFLNGCSTKKQVEQLLEGGIPAVIATSVPITDHGAVDFSVQFYTELTRGSTLKVAFDIASAYLMSKYDKKNRPAVVYRDISWEEVKSDGDEIPWGLYIGSEQDDILNWQLGGSETYGDIDYATLENYATLESANFSTTETDKKFRQYEPNQYLVDFIYEGINRWEPQEDIPTSIEDKGTKILFNEFFPYPIQIQLDRLLRQNPISGSIHLMDLQGLIFTYQDTTRFIAFTYLAQLMNIIEEEQIHLSTSNVLLTRFFGLNEKQRQTFDYLQLANDIDKVFREHEITPQIKEQVKVLQAFDEQEELSNIHLFMKKLFPLIVENSPSGVVEGLDLLYQQAEYCLGKLLEQLAFYVRYELVLVQNLEADPSVKSSVEQSNIGITSSDLTRYAPFGKDNFNRTIELPNSIPTPAVRLVRTTTKNDVGEHTNLQLLAENIVNGLDLSFLLKGSIDVSYDMYARLFVFDFKSNETLHFTEYSGSFNNFDDFGQFAMQADHIQYSDFTKILKIDSVKQSPKRFRYANYNADAPNGEDHLDIMPDVRAFANLIASQDLKPPLSIGLFGDWGSGKSFFMGKLKKEVAEYERMAKRELAKSADEFVDNLQLLSDPIERKEMVRSLFPQPNTQIDQIKEWIKKWEKKRDPSSLRSLGGVFGLQANKIRDMLEAGELKDYTEEAFLIEKLVEGQEREATQLANHLLEGNDLAESMVRKLAELSSESQLGYCRNIAQIEFNAWHYIDTNLWASLITNILEDLNTYVGNLPQEEKKYIQLFRDLATTHQLKAEVEIEIIEIEQKIETIEDGLEKLKKDKEKAEEELTNIRHEDVFELLSAEDKNVQKIVAQIKEQGSDIYEKIGLAQFDVNKKDAEQKVNQLKREIGSTWFRMKAWYLSFKALKPKSKLIFLILLVVPFVALWLIPLLADQEGLFKNFIAKVTEFPLLQAMAPVFAWIVDGTALGQKLLGRINEAGDVFNVAQAKLDKLKAMATFEYDKKIKAKQADLLAKQTKLDEANQRKAAHDIRKEELEKDLREIESGKRLSAFIERRLLSNDYQQHLGLISLIREDFERLTSYLHDRGFYAKVVNRLQGILDADGQAPAIKTDIYKLEKIDTIDRIVLYIDDLDRCPPQKVVEVLQAIHLILAFPLFVVVVGVDVRWISLSLAKEYGSMLSPSGGIVSQNSGMETHSHGELDIHSDSGATPYDYIEKIFQIPFQLRTMSNEAKEFFIGKLLEGDMKQAKAASAYTPHPEREKLQVPLTFTKDQKEETKEIQLPEVKPVESQPPENIAQQINIVSDEAAKITPENPVRPVAKHHQQRLEKVSLKVREINFIKAMSPILAGSPRTVKRFVNVCRLIKSHSVWGKPQRVLDGEMTDYETMILILGLVTGIPIFTRFLYDQMEVEGQDKTFQELIDQVETKLNELEQKHLSKLVEPSSSGTGSVAKSSTKSILDDRKINEEALLEEWDSFQKIWGLRENKHNLIPQEDSNHLLLSDFCAKPIRKIKPLFKVAIRFSFRFTEY